MKNLSIFNFSISKTLDFVSNELEKAKIKIAYSLLVVNYLKEFLIIWDNLSYNRLHDIKWNFFSVLLTTFILKILLSRPNRLKDLIHVAQITTAIYLFYSIVIDEKKLDLLITQYSYMLIIYSFYGLGKRWGLIYSAINIIIIIIHLLINDSNDLQYSNHLSHFIYTIIGSINFAVIAISHYYFYGALYGTIKEKNKLSEDLAKTAKDKTNFLSTMSHELRTPLNSVIGMTNILIRKSENQKELKNLEILKFSAESLLNLINNILDFNKIDSNNIKLETIPFNIHQLFESIKSILDIKAKEKHLNFNLEIDKSIVEQNVLGDPTRLGQIILNFLDNAIKFTKTGSVQLKAKTISLDNKTLTVAFSITDTGIGISQEKQQIIFEPFKQAAQNISRKFGGTGLGLAIAKHLIELSGGEIKLKSELNKGTSFNFNLSFPITNDEFHGFNYSFDKIAKHESRDWKILLAEDNEINALILRQIIADWEMNLTVAKNGQDAVDLLINGHYDLILMDIHMPVMNGIEATKKIRNLTDPIKSQIKIIILTASVTEEIRKELSDMQIDEFIGKPFNQNDLYTKIVRQLNSISSTNTTSGLKIT